MKDYAARVRHGDARFLIGLFLTLCLALAAAPGQVSQEKTQAEKVAKKLEKALGTAHQAAEEREALRHFEHEVAEYARLHAKQLAKLGSREEAAAAQKALARAIRADRAKAKPGDVFQPEVQPLLRRLIAAQLSGPDALAARKAVLEGNPSNEEDSVPVLVRVNGDYPHGATLSTVPPSVLLTLPPLPAPLEYRFVGRDLILLDSVAGLIVDFLSSAAPALSLEALP